MINITNKENCCGCNACGDVCSKNAITFKTDNEGFWYPEVNKEKCVDCGLCEKVCPIINVKDLKKNDLSQSVCYAAEHKNIEVVFDSTSGGMFSALADVMYKSGGYVGGAIFNDDFSVRQYISNDKKDLPQLRSSKYLQSHLDGFYKQVRDLLKAGEMVLVCGSPCQMAALRSFLRKDYENLIIADYVCRGINSPKVWRKYLDTYEERYGSPVVYAKSKSKEYGWRNLTQKVILANGKAYFESKNHNFFTKGYLKTNAFCRPSCYDCQFKGFPRISDITLADFWGVKGVDKAMDKDLGTSLILINSKKGEAYFENVKKRINYVQIPFEKALVGNPAFTKPIEKEKVDRKSFFDDLDKMTFTQLAEKYFKNPVPSLRQKIVNRCRLFYNIYRKVGLSPKSWIRLLKYNSIKDIYRGNVMVVCSHCIINIAKSATIEKHGISVIGQKVKFKNSKLETRLCVDSNAKLYLGDGTVIGYGSDVEVFKNASLTFGGKGGSNIGMTIVCGERIDIGQHTMIGRNVTIRDNNGGHYINRVGYRNSRPVIIGDKAWICEQSTIMPGVKIGDGAIVGACAYVTANVPANSLVSGNPAQIVDKDILWKY